MSKEQTMPTTKPESTRSTVERLSGVVPGVVHLALDVADRSQATTIALLQDGRGELVTLVHGGIDFAEKISASFFRLLKKATQRIDDASNETLTGVERVVTGAVKHARETTKVATTAIAGLASN
ncbi:MAG: hypothetical protein NT062_05570 [Proteobacteria bacterium]|nr:hypothetical protein [Pseudomonadota bacterium]